VDPTTNKDDILLFLPLVGLLVFTYLRLDGILGRKKHCRPVRRPMQPVADPADISLMTDPDGRPWS
jgi:hypothetical protein